MVLLLVVKIVSLLIVGTKNVNFSEVVGRLTNMKLTDLVGFGLTVVMIDANGTRVLETLEDVEQEIENRKNKEVK